MGRGEERRHRLVDPQRCCCCRHVCTPRLRRNPRYSCQCAQVCYTEMRTNVASNHAHERHQNPDQLKRCLGRGGAGSIYVRRHRSSAPHGDRWSRYMAGRALLSKFAVADKTEKNPCSAAQQADFMYSTPATSPPSPPLLFV